MELSKKKNLNFDNISMSRIPTVKRKYTVLKSPDVNKTSREQFKREFKAIYLNIMLLKSDKYFINLLEHFLRVQIIFRNKFSSVLILKKKLKINLIT